MHDLIRWGARLTLAAAPLLVSACASTDDVQKAQSTADQALAAAQHAQQTADQAQATAQQADQKADQAQAGVNDLNTKLEEKPKRHRGERG